MNKFFLLLIFFAAVSCSSGEVYFQYRTVNPEGWDKDSLCVFEIEIPAADVLYNVYLHIRSMPDYPCQNIWFFLSQENPGGQTAKDTVEYYLADSRGRWLGKGAGAVKEMLVLYAEDYSFEETGICTFNIGHGMRTERLRGISEIGMRVEKK